MSAARPRNRRAGSLTLRSTRLDLAGGTARRPCCRSSRSGCAAPKRSAERSRGRAGLDRACAEADQVDGAAGQELRRVRCLRSVDRRADRGRARRNPRRASAPPTSRSRSSNACCNLVAAASRTRAGAALPSIASTPLLESSSAPTALARGFAGLAASAEQLRRRARNARPDVADAIDHGALAGFCTRRSRRWRWSSSAGARRRRRRTRRRDHRSVRPGSGAGVPRAVRSDNPAEGATRRSSS